VIGSAAKGRSFKWTDEGEENEDLDITRKHYSEIYLKVERWYYDFGSHKFIQILTFRGGILKKIETGDYGGANWDFTGTKGRETDKTKETEDDEEVLLMLGWPQLTHSDSYNPEILCTYDRCQTPQKRL